MITRLSILLLCLSIIAVNSAALTRGNLLIARLGDNVNVLARYPQLYILEVNPTSGATVQTFDMGCVIDSYQANPVGITFDPDSKVAATVCYESSSSNNRLIKELRMDGTINATTVAHPSIKVFAGLVYNTQAWISGELGFFTYAARGTTGNAAVYSLFSPTLSSLAFTKLQIFNGTFYVNAYVTTPVGTVFSLATLPQGPPTNGFQPWLAVSVSLGPYRFFIYSDTVLYGITLGSTDGSVQKFTYSGTTFTMAYSVNIVAVPSGVTVLDVSGTKTVFVSAANGKVYKFTDTGTSFATPIVLFSISTTNAKLHDVAIIPKAPTCSDRLINSNEGDVDCGGSCPTRCSPGQKCKDFTDCSSSVCNAVTKVCMAPTCSDAIKNGAETSPDCGGGTCPKCSNGQGCKVASDCISGVCGLYNGLIQLCLAPACNDTVKNGNEGDIDCGGSCATKCTPGQSCNVHSDCDSSNCDPATLKCLTGSCSDGVKNGGETDLDCGGSCSGCADYKHCLVNNDCISLVCDGSSCAPANCSDSTKNQNEVDIDCGEVCGSNCEDGKVCATGADCKSNYCYNFQCATPTCHDLILNQNETDLDCGGVCGSSCMNGQVCSTHVDCLSSFCVPDLMLCADMTCYDGFLNQNETDLDCGAVCGPFCENGKKCKSHSDCQSDFCTPDTRLCAQMTCNDSYLNQNETDVDCGGLCGATCENGKKCKQLSDCKSSFCTPDSLVCAKMTCNDGYLNQNETDLDCGGDCGATCEINEACLTNTDCVTNFCFNSACAPVVPTVIQQISLATHIIVNSFIVVLGTLIFVL